MFCNKCGKELKNGEKCICQKNEKIIENSADSIDVNITAIKNKAGFFSIGSKSNVKKLLLILLVVCIGAVGLILFLSSSKTVDEPCDWCDSIPSIEYKTSSGVAYACEDCSKDCYFCKNEATTHYENVMGMLVFACEECYSSVDQW